MSSTFYSAIVFLPLIGALIAGIFGNYIGVKGAQTATILLVLVAALFSWIAFFTIGFGTVKLSVPILGEWVKTGSLSIDWALRVDTLTAVMLVVVTTVSALVHIYSVGYMAEDESQPRFFAYLSFFTFAMLMLVTADNLLQLFFGWEGVGLASYLLIGFWYTKPSANAAAIKAFVVNRVGDFGFALGLCLTFLLSGSIAFDTIFAAAPELSGKIIHIFGFDWNVLTITCLLLFMGAMGKSAQFLLHTWLPDAMEGPTPVSALIHAATMVTAGVFMVARLSPVFHEAPNALAFITFIGGLSAIFAATVGLVQNDIKRVIAYSTCSQLGYMFVALGIGSFSVGIFHLFTHAFFKALLFLGAGSVIHAMHHEQDMRRMGGLRKDIPFTFWMMVIGTLALTGVGIPFTSIGFAGFVSKDAIIEQAYDTAFRSGNLTSIFAFLMIVLAAGLTSFYSWRLIFLTFFGSLGQNTHLISGGGDDLDAVSHGHSEADGRSLGMLSHGTVSNGTVSNDSHGPDIVIPHIIPHIIPHESPPIMLIPLAILAVGAIFAGSLFHSPFIGSGQESFWSESLYLRKDGEEGVPAFVSLLPTFMMLGGLLVAWYVYIVRPGTASVWARSNKLIYNFLLHKWYFDELYELIFVRPAFWLGHFFWKVIDGKIIDGFGPNGISYQVSRLGGFTSRLQTGYLYHYAFAMMLGVAAFVSWYLIAGVQ